MLSKDFAPARHPLNPILRTTRHFTKHDAWQYVLGHPLGSKPAKFAYERFLHDQQLTHRKTNIGRTSADAEQFSRGVGLKKSVQAFNGWPRCSGHS